jgi:orotate phosphoribosyltransferase
VTGHASHDGGAAGLRERLIEVVRRGLLVLDEPVTLRSGELSRYFIDGKAAFSRGEDLQLACRLLLEAVERQGLGFDAVGGLTMGADPFAHGIVMLRPDVAWFSVRKEPKGRGTDRMIEGARLTPGSRVLLVDDVVTKGGSIRKAYEAVVEIGATVVAAVTLVDRADEAGAFFAERGVPYFPLLTYRDLGIPAVGREVVPDG